MKKMQIKKPKVLPKNIKNEPHIKVIMILLLVFILGFTIYYVYDINKSISTQESFIDTDVKTSDEFSPKYKVVLIYSNSCGYCSRFMPIFNEVTSSMINIKVEKHVTGSPESQKYMKHVQGVPFTVIEKNDAIISKKAGFMNAQEFKSWLTTFIL